MSRIRRFAATRRRFLKRFLSLPFLGMMESPTSEAARADSTLVNALLISSTTLSGKASLEHGYEALADLYKDRKKILLINFASLPEDRDSYEKRMQQVFSNIGSGFEVSSLHRVPVEESMSAIEGADAFYVSGGNTFLLLRELYDRKVIPALRNCVSYGIPYAGSSAGSNIAGVEIGTTNDFPLVDVPTRRSLGLLDVSYNPHHPEPETEKTLFASRQWKIQNYCKYNTDTTVLGVTNPGMVRVSGKTVTLLGENAYAFVQRGDRHTSIHSNTSADLTTALSL
ncbi:dipeptidase PepE [Puniceicoccaceae bacterium K14]|nr:dipeptidase PepE [Puniceicoccaceae bacterium K14]